ncbi:FAD/FMN-containing isoamyl alcohol oxidase MreA [Xylariales sp. PMI_506]|nr:FAD/FMN-containing isoamyl alcohol oxidase MreA [Xylariales sp. PMI_506]
MSIKKIGIFLATALWTVGEASECRCFPGDSCWPGNSDWASFNTSIGGRLIQTVPIGAVCHGASYNESACQIVQDTWTDPATHYESAHSLLDGYWANKSCDPFTAPDVQCVVGTYVQYAVNASSPEHVSQTIQFARKNNLRLVIRNTAHDYIGKSTGAGAIAIWTHNIKSTAKLNWKDMQYSGPAIKIGAGVQGWEAVGFADTHKLVIVTGYCPTVGTAGGYIQGGGHSALATKFGLAADNALEFEVIDGKGQYLIANRNQNADLFWALSGGGGGTYGVVLSATVKAYPTMPVVSTSLEITSIDLSYEISRDVVAAFHRVLPSIVDAGCYVLAGLSGTTFSITDLVAPGLTAEAVDTLLAPFLAFLKQNSIAYQQSSSSFPTYYNYVMGGPPSNYFENAANNIQIGNWFMPRSIVIDHNKDKQYIDALFNITQQGAIVAMLCFNVSNKKDNAVFPGWRDVLIFNMIELPTTLTESLEDEHVALEEINANMLPLLRDISPDSGCYLNEANPLDPNWKTNFYGVNYNKLESIKNKYDPYHMFYGLTAVGSDYWIEQADKRLCRS